MRRLALAVLVTAVVVSPFRSTNAAESLSASEPAYQGKPLTYWLAALEPGRPASAQPKQAEAEEAIHYLGPDVVPLLLKYSRGDRTQRLAVIRHACSILEPEGNVKLADALIDPNSGVRETALEVLPDSALQIGMDGMVKALTDPVSSVRSAAVRALIRLAPAREETIAALIDVLRETTPNSPTGDTAFSKEDAALALAGLGPKAKAAVPELTDLLGDPNDDLREAAATALWRIERNPRVIPLLVERLDEAKDYQTCLRVMKLLGEMGPLAKSAVPTLQKKIEIPGVDFVPATIDLSQAALQALTKIDPQAAAQARKKTPKEE